MYADTPHADITVVWATPRAIVVDWRRRCPGAMTAAWQSVIMHADATHTVITVVWTAPGASNVARRRALGVVIAAGTVCVVQAFSLPANVAAIRTVPVPVTVLHWKKNGQ